MVEGLSAEERYKIGFSCDILFGRLEQLHSLLLDLWNEYFTEDKPKSITECDVEKIGNRLYVYTDAMFSIIREYALMMGNMDFPGVGPYLDLAHSAEQAAECESLIDRVREIEYKENPFVFPEKLKDVWTLPDKKAIPALRAILDEK